MPVQLLKDSFGRVIGDLRISVTDRCNFRCTYCIPVENIDWKPKQEILSWEEIERLVGMFAGLGIRKVRVTGGEPLLRPDLLPFLTRISSIEGIEDLSITTNGRFLAAFAPGLKAAGVKRLNVSLDSLRPDRFFEMTRRRALGDVLEGIEAARAAGFERVKVNAVVIRGINDDEIVDFARFAMGTGHTVRFIEFMPLDSGHQWSVGQVVTGAEIVERIAAELPLRRLEPTHPAETATRFGFRDGAGEIGVIAPVSAPFCGNCNRIRLTADGQLRTCLFSIHEHDLKTPMRQGESDLQLTERVARAVFAKEAGHRINKPDFVQPERTMSCIGG